MTTYWPDYVVSTCRQNYTYFDSGEFLLSAYHFIAFFTLPLAIFTFFVIVRVTPRKMKNMKIPMIIAHACSTNLDLFITILASPCLFTPSAAGVPLGIFSTLGVSSRFVAYYGEISVWMMAINFILFLESRHSQIPMIRFKIKNHKFRLAYFAVNYILALMQGCQKGRGSILYLSSQPWKNFASSGGLVEDQKISRCTKIQPIWLIRGLDGPKRRGPRPAVRQPCTDVHRALFFDSDDQLELRKFVLKRIPCPVVEFYEKSTLVLLKGRELLPFLAISVGMTMVLGQTMFFSIHTIYHLNYVKNASVSESTKVLQRRFLGYVAMQMAIPWVVLAGPILYSLYADRNDYYNQAFNNFSELFMAIHGLLSNSCTLFIIKPYRVFVRNLTRGKIDFNSSETWAGTIAIAPHVPVRLGSVSG
ncbi:hypothetical protein CRE_09474 [Caenorhabditis remanei]|uniref:Uncharacterized protein n=1 Tax=Caenorhabditis remanei TaxID=31234 RepID=E3LJ45_CAERE|nr:hypothetical protein CRE_09474 [Caenorhabditis remanei]